MSEKQLFEGFSQLCLQDRVMLGSDGESIGTYSEKRFHRIFKRFITEDAERYEVKVGRYVADVLCDGHITEIQTRQFGKIVDKIRYYLENTDYTVSVVKPLIAEKRIIRADKETGEVRYTKRSPKKEGIADALLEIYYLRELVANERLMIHLIYLKADEYRYSDRVRYRRTGKYDSDLCPTEIIREEVLCGKEDYRRFLPDALGEGEFTVKEYSAKSGICGMPAYSALKIMTALGILDVRTENKKFYFKKIHTV